MNDHSRDPHMTRPKLEPFTVESLQKTFHEKQGVMHPQVITQAPSKPKRGQANRRERVRTENVNAGFDKLRKLIPTEPKNRKLSKIEILRLSTSYIKHLYNLSRANSCLEAEKIDSRSAPNEGVCQDDKDAKPRNHVCTFCLMRTKIPSVRS